MKQLFLLLILFLCCASAQAVTITVGGTTFPGYQYPGTTAKLRFYSSLTFTDSNGVSHAAGIAGSTTGFFLEINCTISASTLNIPSFSLPSTNDGVPNNSRVTAVLFDAAGIRRDTLFANWIIPTTDAPTRWSSPTTWQALNIFNHSVQKPLADTYATLPQVSQLINSRIAAGGSTPGGSNTQMQVNTAGLLTGVPSATYDGSVLTFNAPVVDNPTLNNPQVTGNIKDGFGHTIIGLGPTLPSTNYVNITNGGGTVGVVAAGASADVNIRFGPKGAGQLIFPSLAGQGTKCPHVDNNGVMTLASTDCGTGGGSGTVTNTSGPLSINAVMVGVGGYDSKTQAGVEAGVGTLQLFQGVITNNLPQLSITTTVNNGSEDFTGITGNWTDQASHSLTLMKLSVGGIDQFRINKVGNAQLGSLNFGGATNSFPALKRDTIDSSFLALRLGDNSGATGMTGTAFRTTGGSQLTTFRGVDLASTHGIFFKSGTDPLIADWDVELYRESPGVLAVGDGTLNPISYRDMKMRNLTLQSPAGNVITLKAPSTGTPIYTFPSGFVAGQYMKVDASGNLSFDTPVGAGNVVGPSSSVTNSSLTCFDGTSGTLLKQCGLTLSGTNTGDQNTFSSIVVAGQTTVTANSTGTAWTAVAGSNMTITTDNMAKTLTFAAAAGGGGGLPDSGSNGAVARVALNTTAARTFQGAANRISITNADLVAGDPVFTIPNAAELNIAKITNLTSNGHLQTTGGAGAISVDTSTYLTANQTITVSGDASASGTTSLNLTIGANKILDSMIRQGGARSVVGRSAGSTGNVADIVATNGSDAVLRESGGSIGFGAVATAGIANAAVTYAKIQNVNASKLMGRGDGGAGAPQEVTLGAGLSMSGATLNAAGSSPAQTGLLGVLRASTTPTDAANPVAIVQEDARVNVERVMGEFADFSTAISTIGSTPTTLVMNSNQTFTSSVVVPATLSLRFTNAGKLTCNSPCVVTLQTGKVLADLRQQIFAGSGTFKFTGEYPREFSPNWWGAVPDSTISSVATDNLPYFKAVEASMQAGIPSSTSRHYRQGGVVRVPGGAGCYGLSGTWEIYRPTTITGDGPAVGGAAVQGSLLCFPGGVTGIFVHTFNTSDTYTATAATGTRIKDLALIGRAASADGTASATAGGLVITRTTGSVDFTSNFGAAHTITLGGFVYVVRSIDSPTQMTLRKPRLVLSVTNGSATVANDASQAWPATSQWSGQQIKINGKPYTISSNTGTSMTLSAPFAEASNPSVDAEVQTLGSIAGASITLNRFHGIDAKAEVEISNVIVQSFSGDGVSIDTSLSPPLSDTFSGTVTTNGTTTVTASSAVFKPEFYGRTFTLSGGGSLTGTIADVGCSTAGCTSTTASLSVTPGWSSSGNTLVIGIANLMNADNSRLDRIDSYLNAGSGLMLHGIDSNQMTIMNTNTSQNLGAGILEESFLGNAYVGSHTRDNGYGGLYTDAESAVNSSTFEMLYLEGGQPSAFLAQYEGVYGRVLGSGVMARGSLGAVTGTDRAWLSTTGLRWIRRKDDSAPGTPGVTLGSYLGDRDPASMVFSSMAVAEDTASSSPQGGAIDTPLPVYNWAYNHYGTGWFSLYYNDAAGSTNKDLIAVSGSQASVGSDKLQFPNGFTVPSGNVGIGTTSPLHKLQVAGDGVFTGAVNFSGVTSGVAVSYGGTPNTGNITSITTGTTYRDMQYDALSHIFETGGGSVTERMRIDPAGNVGIGTATPQSKLQVNGQLTIDPLGTYNILGFPVNHYALNISGDINPVKDCAQNGVGAGLSIFLRLNGVATNCGDEPLAKSSLLVSMDDANNRGTEAAVNIAYQDFAQIVNGAPTLTIISATNTNPVEFTLSANAPSGYPYNFNNGASWLIEGATGNWSSVNGWNRITVTAPNKFTIPVNSSSLGSLTGSLKNCYVCSSRTAGGLNGTLEFVLTTDNPNIDDPLTVPTAPNVRSVTQTIFTGGSHQATAALAIVNFDAFNAAPFTADSSHWPKTAVYIAEAAKRGIWFDKRPLEDLSDPFSDAMILADAPTANIIRGVSGRTITNGFDISPMTVTGNAFASPGIKITGSGDVGILTSGKGVIIKASDASTCHRITVTDANVISSATVLCP